ncbi:small, acid-soluble spore protein, alpha/beta type [Paenibacillus sp. HJGM_3]|uniref:small, acid-soluble spore protein, alpha/beta type n=1 Tax=Paenibacillus sp. HJGM_3 TaxID=3379816 RepID=UPI00385B49B8
MAYNQQMMQQSSQSSQSSGRLVVPQASTALDQMKYEVAQELGIQIPQDGYMGYMATRDAGAIGGHITRRLIQIAEQQLSGQFNR